MFKKENGLSDQLSEILGRGIEVNIKVIYFLKMSKLYNLICKIFKKKNE